MVKVVASPQRSTATAPPRPKSSPTYSPIHRRRKQKHSNSHGNHTPTKHRLRSLALFGRSKRDHQYMTLLAGGILSCWSMAVLLHSFATDSSSQQNQSPRVLLSLQSSSSFSLIPQQQHKSGIHYLSHHDEIAFSTPRIPTTPQSVQKPLQPLRVPAKRIHTPNYGDLELDFDPNLPQFTRTLRDPDLEFDDAIWKRQRDPWDDVNPPLDDDYRYNRNAATDDYVKEHDCQTPDWAKRAKPTCNEFHSADFTDQVMGNTCKLLGKGTFNSAFSINHNELVWKTLRYNGEKNTMPYTNNRLQHTRKDAVISETLSSHELIVDIFGYCGLATLSEFLGGHGDLADYAFVRSGPDDRYECMDDDALEWANEDKPLIAGNNLSALEKIRFSLDLAESMALIHNRPEGVWVHLDVWLEQFLVFEKADGTLGAKMNDFNNAKLLAYDFEHGEYCPLYTGYQPDRSNAPEETHYELSGQERDVYRLGTCFYSLLTGVQNYPLTCDDEEAAHKMADGKVSYFDPRWKEKSIAEGVLVDVTKEMWAVRPQDRPDIGYVVKRLRQALEDQLKHPENPIPTRGLPPMRKREHHDDDE